MSDLSSNPVLDCPMDSTANDAEAATVREYLVKLLAALWDEQDEFSGKRPFGNSGWSWDLYKALVLAGLVRGTVDHDGYLDEVDTVSADRLIRDAIPTLAGGVPE